jgi:hypothetical protein
MLSPSGLTISTVWLSFTFVNLAWLRCSRTPPAPPVNTIWSNAHLIWVGHVSGSLSLTRIRVSPAPLPLTETVFNLSFLREEFTTGTGQPFTRLRFQRIRYDYKIPTSCPHGPAACPDGQRGDGRYSARAAAELLNESRSGARWTGLSKQT